MNLLQKAITAISGWIPLERPIGDRSDAWSGWSYHSDAGEAVTERTVLALSAAWACMNLIAGTMGSLPLNVYRKIPGGREIAFDHPLFRLLHDSPNADQTSVDFWEFAQAALELRGNAYAEKHYGVMGNVVALTPIWPDLMTVARGPGNTIQYRWNDGLQYNVAGSERILHIRGFGGSPFGGMSTLSHGRHVFGLATALNKSAAKTFDNGIQTTGAFKSATKFATPAQRSEMRDLIAEQYAGSRNSGKPMFLDGDLAWQAMSINPDDAQMLQSRQLSVEDVCRMFGVPPHMIGHTAGTTQLGSSVEDMTLGWHKLSLNRRVNRNEKALKMQLLSPADIAAGISIGFDLDELMAGDSAGRSAFYGSALDHGWMTINEVRRKEGLPPVEGGDVPRMQAQNIPITQTSPLALPASGASA